MGGRQNTMCSRLASWMDCADIGPGENVYIEVTVRRKQLQLGSVVWRGRPTDGPAKLTIQVLSTHLRQRERGSVWSSQKQRHTPPKITRWNLKNVGFQKPESPFPGADFQVNHVKLQGCISWHFKRPRLWRLPVPFSGSARRIHGGSTCKVWHMADEYPNETCLWPAHVKDEKGMDKQEGLEYSWQEDIVFVG